MILVCGGIGTAVSLETMEKRVASNCGCCFKDPVLRKTGDGDTGKSARERKIYQNVMS